MKSLTSIICIVLIVNALYSQNGNIGIGTETPEPSAILDISSSNQGILIPRVQLTSSSDAQTILSPATGLLVYNSQGTLAAGFYYWNGTSWVKIDGAGGGHSGCTSLQGAYDCPANGQGRAINAANGAVEISAPTTATNTTALKVNSNNNASLTFNGERSSVGGSGLDAYYKGTGNGVAIWAEANNANSTAVAAIVGTNKSNTQKTAGVRGEGYNGVYGQAKTAQGCGVQGINDNSTNVDEEGVGVFGRGTMNGVWGETSTNGGCGLCGINYNGSGGYGLYAEGTTGVKGRTKYATNVGVIGENTATTGGNGVKGKGYIGVYGEGRFGVVGKSTNTASGYYHWGLYTDDDIYGDNLYCEGGKSFLIPHPTKPNKFLKHTCIESPMPVNMYCGNAILNNSGEAIVELPDYFSEININFRYQLTPFGSWAGLYIKDDIKDNHFVIGGGKPGMKVSWTVYADRYDEYVRTHPGTRVDVFDQSEELKQLFEEAYKINKLQNDNNYPTDTTLR